MKITISLVIASFAVAFLLGGMFYSKTVIIREETAPLRILAEDLTSSASMFVPAVDENGNGVATTATVSVEPGKGRTLTSIKNILFFADTQNSIRTAQQYAEEFTHSDLSRHDLIYDINAEASVIEGPSAGAALTIATIAALEGRELRGDVMITGTINPDGSIGRVGKVAEKAQAAKDVGARIFLIPANTGDLALKTQKQYQSVTRCKQTPYGEMCETVYEETVIQSSQVDIQIIPVSSVEEALEYVLV